MRDRTKYIGGSDLGGILNVCDHSSPMLVWHRKVSGETKEMTDNMYFGTVLEPVVKKEFKKRNKHLKVTKASFLKHDLFPYLGGIPDGYVVEEDGKKCILEIKTANEYMKGDWDNNIPPHYYAQVQWYMGLSDLDKAYVVCLCGGNKYFQYEVPRCDAYIENAVNKAVGFWNGYVLTKIRPWTTGKNCDKRLLGQRIESSENDVVLRSNYIDDPANEYNRFKKQEKDLKKKISLSYNRILEEMGNHKKVESHTFKMEYKNIQRTSVDTNMLKETYPDVFEKVKKQGNSLRLSIKEKTK